MPDDIQKIIYKVEIDDSAYIAGIESLSGSTKKFAQAQEDANKRLQTNELALKQNSEFLQKAKKDLDDYTGTNERYRKQLEKSLTDAQKEQVKLTYLVNNNRKAYEAAQKAAQDFANISKRAGELPTRQPLIPPPGVAAGLSAQINQTLNIPDLAAHAQVVAQTKKEFDELRDSIQLADEALKGMSSDSEEFKQLAPIVEQGKIALQQYDEAAKFAGGATISLRQEILNGNNELARLVEAGKGASKEYQDLEIHVAHLSELYKQQRERVAVLSSQTRALDFGKAAVSSAIAGFEAYTAISILAGDQSEELQKKTMQLFAAMQLLHSLELLVEQTKRGSIIATNLQSAAQATYTAIVGASTGALRVFRLALAATGIGAVIAGIAFLVIKLNEISEASKEAAEEQKALTEVGQEAAKSFAAEVTHLGLIKDRLNDLTIPQKERVRLAKEYNKTADEANKIDLKQIDNIKLINAAIDTQIAKIKERGLARAAETIIAQKAEAVFKLQAEIEAKSPVIVDKETAGRTQRLRDEQKALEDRANVLIANRSKLLGIKPPSIDEVLALSGLSDDQIKAGSANSKKLQLLQDEAVRNQLRTIDQQRTSIQIANTNIPRELRKLFEDLGAAEAELRIATKVGSSFITADNLVPPPGSKGDKDIENVFAQKLKELQAKLAEVTAKSFESEGTIRKQFQASLEKEILSLNDLVKNKKLTQAQSEILIELTTRINQVQLDQALGEFNQKVSDARQKLNEELKDLQDKNTLDTINLLQDEFDKRRQLIDFNEKQEIEDSKINTDKRLQALELDKFLIGEEKYQEAKNAIVQAGEDEQTNIIIKAAQDRQALAADSFKNALKFFENAILEIDLIDDKESSERIRAASNNFLQGKIKYEEFQKQLEKIQKEYAAKKRNRDILILQGELDSLDNQIKITEDKTSAHYKELIRLRDELDKKLTDKKTQDAIEDAKDKGTSDTSKKVESVQQYAEAIGQVTDSIIQFWQKANEAEANALDRSISLQEKRVDAAQRIAERGNAQYLKAEEDRLKELQVARENAARKQLGIDAALQASQILVGITGAIAKIATGIGAAETIAEIAIIVGALATGYGLVKSLQGNQPRLFKGTKDTGKGGKEDEKGGFTATLHPHEAVIPAHRNKEYKETVAAIYDGTVPADHLNKFVQTYHKVKSVPQVNYERIKEAAEISIGSDGRMAVLLNEHSNLLKENNELQRQILKKKIHVENKIDRDGVASMVTDYITQMEINKRV